MEQKYTVDARGEQCPIPVVRTKKVLDGILGDAELTVLVDNETAVQNLTRMGKHAGAEVLSEKKSDNEFQVVIRVKDRKPTEGGEETAECIPDVKGDFVIAVDTAIMGRGNDELGKVLMKGFIFAVTQLEKLPKTILFTVFLYCHSTAGAEKGQKISRNLSDHGFTTLDAFARVSTISYIFVTSPTLSLSFSP